VQKRALKFEDAKGVLRVTLNCPFGGKKYRTGAIRRVSIQAGRKDGNSWGRPVTRRLPDEDGRKKKNEMGTREQGSRK